MKSVLLPFVMIFVFVLESIISDLVPIPFLSEQQTAVPRVLVLAIVLLAAYGSMKLAMLYGFIFGLLFDIVYTEVIGIYAFAFPVLAYFVFQALRVLHKNAIILIFLTELAIALLEFFVYGIYFLIGVTNMPLYSFTNGRLLPTLALNFVLACLLIYPLKKIILSLQKEKMRD